MYDEETVLAPNGNSGVAIATAGRETFLRILCQEIHDPSPSALEKWLDCLGTILTLQEQGLDVSWEKLSRRLALQFYGEDRWPNMPQGQRLAWEGAARTMANWCTATDEEDYRAIREFDWQQWALHKMEKVQ